MVSNKNNEPEICFSTKSFQFYSCLYFTEKFLHVSFIDLWNILLWRNLAEFFMIRVMKRDSESLKQQLFLMWK